jgi:hypothetical protein
LGSSSVVINEAGADVDFRVEGDTDANLLFVDASADKVGFGTNTPSTKIDATASGATVANFNRTTSSGSTVAVQVVGSTVGTLGSDTGGNGRFDISSVAGGSSADSIQISRNGGTLTALFNPSGNLGLGVTPSAWSNGKAIEVGFAGRGLWGFTQAVGYLTTNAYYNSGFKYGGTGTATAYAQDTGQHIFYTAPSGSANAAITFTQAMTLTAAGDLLVGTTSTFSLSSGSATGSFILAGGAYVASRDDNLIGLRRTNSNGNVTEFYRSTTSVGSISVTTTATAFNTSSDRRLKENIAPAEDAGEIIDAIEIVKHDWKAGGHTRYGAIAQDLYSVAPEAVLAGDDGEEVEKTWGVDYSKLVPMLVKEVQSLRKRVAELEAK